MSSKGISQVIKLEFGQGSSKVSKDCIKEDTSGKHKKNMHELKSKGRRYFYREWWFHKIIPINPQSWQSVSLFKEIPNVTASLSKQKSSKFVMVESSQWNKGINTSFTIQTAWLQMILLEQYHFLLFGSIFPFLYPLTEGYKSCVDFLMVQWWTVIIILIVHHILEWWRIIFLNYYA